MCLVHSAVAFRTTLYLQLSDMTATYLLMVYLRIRNSYILVLFLCFCLTDSIVLSMSTLLDYMSAAAAKQFPLGD